MRHTINAFATPTTIYLSSVALFAIAMWKMEIVVKPLVMIPVVIVTVLGTIFALTDDHFFKLVTLPDNIPITIMLATVGYFTWYALKKGVENDKRLSENRPLIEQEQDRRVMTWPNLVYIEFICLIAITVFLIFWSIGFQAPLEEPANPTVTPNPAKAPWYFLGLQEMLVYFDPWLAGVVFPGLIVVGLMALPYIDPNPKGNGYYSFKDRRLVIGYYLFGFLIQWVLLIVLGTFMRGPGWSFFGPFQEWDPHKVEALTNINLSELLWVKLLNIGLPKNILLREGVGIVVVLGYLVALPPLLAKTIFKKLYQELSFIRFQIMCFLFLAMLSLPIKMILRWTINLKYIVAIPEFFFNI
ncbi:MAG: hypothetical protein KDD48_03315 [Bdellovibrionales bacterium]|nr:hypothetical protein [Bdellovibrionales bacterium]